MPHLRVKVPGATESVKLYPGKSSIKGARSGVLSVCAGGTAYYVQTLADTETAEIAACDKKGCGRTALMYIAGGVRHYVCRAAYTRGYTALYTLTAAQTLTVPKSSFSKYGGVILLYGGRGSDSNGYPGGTGQIKRIEIPAGIETDVTVSVSFPRTSTGGGANKSASGTFYTCSNITYTPYRRCSSYRAAVPVSTGGAGGLNCTATWSFGGKSGSGTAYGGGGAAEGRVSGYASCSVGYMKCNLSNYRSVLGTAGAGGRSGNGIPASGSLGASAVSGGEYSESSLSARLIIGAYNE